MPVAGMMYVAEGGGGGKRGGISRGIGGGGMKDKTEPEVELYVGSFLCAWRVIVLLHRFMHRL